MLRNALIVIALSVSAIAKAQLPSPAPEVAAQVVIHAIESIGIVDSPDVSIPMPMQCQVLPPQPWDKKAFEEALGITLPDDIKLEAKFFCAYLYWSKSLSAAEC